MRSAVRKITDRGSASGFTLIELLVVIAIIAILAALILASTSGARRNARDAQRMSDMRQLRIAIEEYYDDSNTTICGNNELHCYPTCNGNNYCLTFSRGGTGSLQDLNISKYYGGISQISDPLNGQSAGGGEVYGYIYARDVRLAPTPSQPYHIVHGSDTDYVLMTHLENGGTTYVTPSFLGQLKLNYIIGSGSE